MRIFWIRAGLDNKEQGKIECYELLFLDYGYAFIGRPNILPF